MCWSTITRITRARRPASGCCVRCSAKGLLIAEGRAWKHQRRTLAPAFTPRAVTTLVPHMVAATDETIAKLKAASNAPVDLREAMQRMTLEIAGRTMFSFGMDRHGAALRDFVMEYGERLARPHFLDLLLPLGWPSPQDFARARFRKRWTAFVAMLMAERRAAGKNEGAPPRDLFDLMGAARDPETGAAFTDEQLGDEVATMILAGHETTATALFWSLYLLALDPATQEELAAEVQGGDRQRRARYRAAEIHPRGGRRDHAALSAGVPDRARRGRAGYHRRHAGEEEGRRS